MWPERRLKLLATPDAQGLAGFQALLQIVGKKYTQGDPLQEIHSYDEWGGEIITDLIIWPDVAAAADYSRRGSELGQQVMGPGEFLKNLWQTEVILPVNPPYPQAGERPILWLILREAGFAPSLLWQDKAGTWFGEYGQGLDWVVPGDWLAELARESFFGRQRSRAQITWVVRENRIDYYEVCERLQFRGFVPRWPEPLEEQEACQAIAQALELGVSLFDVRSALDSIWKNTRQGCQGDDIGWAQGPGGTELSSEEFNDLEDRRTG
ncbi:MAG: hypothetical protein ACYCVD_06545 [Desulfitobacteriaceae bacterium]